MLLATTSGGGGGQLVIAAVFAGEYWLVAISLMRMGFVRRIRFLAQGCNKLDQAHQIGKRKTRRANTGRQIAAASHIPTESIFSHGFIHSSSA